MRRDWHPEKYCIWIVLIAVWTVGCSSVTQNPAATADFSITANPTTAGLTAGAAVKAYGVPQANGTLRSYVLAYFTGQPPAQ